MYFDSNGQLYLIIIADELPFTIFEDTNNRRLNFIFKYRHLRKTLTLVLLPDYLISDSHARKLNRHQLANLSLTQYRSSSFLGRRISSNGCLRRVHGQMLDQLELVLDVQGARGEYVGEESDCRQVQCGLDGAQYFAGLFLRECLVISDYKRVQVGFEKVQIYFFWVLCVGF